MCTVGHNRTNEHDPVLKHIYPQSDQPITLTIQILLLLLLLLLPCASNNKLDLILNATDGRDSVVNIAFGVRTLVGTRDFVFTPPEIDAAAHRAFCKKGSGSLSQGKMAEAGR